MQSTSPIKTLLRFTFCFFLVLSVVFSTNNSYAANNFYDGVRDKVTYSESRHTCDTGPLEFDPLLPNRDITWEIPQNEYCNQYVASVGALLIAAWGVGRLACPAWPTNLLGKSKNAIEKPSYEPPLPGYPVVGSVRASVNYFSKCTTRSLEATAANISCIPPPSTAYNPTLCATASQTSMNATSCCVSAASYAATLAGAVAALAIMYDTAKIAYENARICGAQWNTWKEKADGSWIKGKGTYQKCVNQLFTKNGDVDDDCDDTKDTDYKIRDDLDRNGQAEVALTNKYYREYIYGGVEYPDQGEGNCSNPSAWDSDERMEYLGYDDSEQYYYMTGAGAAPGYHCRRFLPRKGDKTPEDLKSVADAYDCCVNRSSTAICIESKSAIDIAKDKVTNASEDVFIGVNQYRTEFCKLGSKCSVANVVYDIYEGETPNYICAKTYSSCPYNHPLGGGTEQEEFYPDHDMEHIGQRKNFCQYMKHCVKIPIKPYFRSSNLKGAYISSACKNLKGDAQNVLGYTSQLVPVNSNNFTAPIAQCFKETMENIFLNKAGFSQCSNTDEVPINDVCITGYTYRKGYDLGKYNPGQESSFFIKIQDKLQGVIQMALVLSVVAFGFMILIGVPQEQISKKVLLSYILKMGLVMYFAVGDGWQFGFMNGVLSSSSYLSELTFRPDEKGIEVKDGSGNFDKSNLDGCQFPRFNYADDNFETKYDNPAYPPGKSYLRIWDTLDCKIARALGYAPGASIPNVLMMFLAGFLTSGYGIAFVLATFFVAFLMISIAIRALHIFLLSTTAVVILMYVSPIMITLKMFKRTEKMFESWWKQLLGFTLQPMILFAYLGILITFIDSTIIGDVKFTGVTRYDATEQVTYLNDFSGDAEKGIDCTGKSANSVYCIFNTYEMGTNNDLAVIGIGLPVLLLSMDADKIQSLIVAGFLLFIFMSFLDQIASFAQALVGGGSLASDWGGMGAMAKRMGQLGSGLSSAGERAVRGSAKAAGAIARQAGEQMSGGKGKSKGSGGDSKGKESQDSALDSDDGNSRPLAINSREESADADVRESGAEDAIPAALAGEGGDSDDPTEAGETPTPRDDVPVDPSDPDAETKPKEQDDDDNSVVSDNGNGGGSPLVPSSPEGETETPRPDDKTDNKDDAIVVPPLPGGGNNNQPEDEKPDEEPVPDEKEEEEKEEEEGYGSDDGHDSGSTDEEGNDDGDDEEEDNDDDDDDEDDDDDNDDDDDDDGSDDDNNKGGGIPPIIPLPGIVGGGDTPENKATEDESPDVEPQAHAQEENEKEEPEETEAEKENEDETPDLEPEAHAQEQQEEEPDEEPEAHSEDNQNEEEPEDTEAEKESEDETPDLEPEAHAQEQQEEESDEEPEAHSEDNQNEEEPEDTEAEKESEDETPDLEPEAHAQEQQEEESDAEPEAHSEDNQNEEESEDKEPEAGTQRDREGDTNIENMDEGSADEDYKSDDEGGDQSSSDNAEDSNSDVSSLSSESSDSDDSSQGGKSTSSSGGATNSSGRSHLLDPTASSSAKETKKSNAVSNQEPFYAGGSASSQGGKSASTNGKGSQSSRGSQGSSASKKARPSSLHHSTAASRGQRTKAKATDNRKPIQAGGVVRDGGGKQKLAGKKANIKTAGGGHAKNTALSASRQRPAVARTPIKTPPKAPKK